MSNKLTGFESGLKKALENHEVPYNPESWDSLNSKLNSGSSKSDSSSLVAAAMTLLVIAGSSFWYFFASDAATSAHRATLSELVVYKDSFASIRMKAMEAREWHEMIDESAIEERNVSSASGSENNDSAVSSASSTVVRQDSNQNRNSIAPRNNQVATATEVSTDPVMNIAELPASGGYPAIPISVSAREACAGTSVDFSISSELVNASYLWNFGDGSFSNKPNPVHTYIKPGTYDITLSVTSKDDGFIRTTTIDNMIVVNPSPEASFTWEFVELDGDNPVVKLSNESQRAEKCEWVITESNYRTEINPVHTFNENGLNIIELVVSNEFGCQDKKVKALAVNEDYSLQANETFSPNGDGNYDNFMPRGLMDGRMMFEMIIYQNDEQVFRTTSPKKAWDGTLPNGTVAQIGNSFNWVVIVYQKNGDQKFYSGDLSVTP
ncbi:MAG: PKD domain-containing protein [Cryomorphaceae bacterium]|nr:PKD domain-containing protein [Cryomorphaceae bacterium]